MKKGIIDKSNGNDLFKLYIDKESSYIKNLNLTEMIMDDCVIGDDGKFMAFEIIGRREGKRTSVVFYKDLTLEGDANIA